MKIDRSKVRELFNQGLRDREIAERLNCKSQTVYLIRKELHLLKGGQFFLNEYRRAYFNRKAKQTVIYLPKVMIDKMNFNQGDAISYKITFEAPNRIMLDFKPEKDVSHILKRRWEKSTKNVKNVENHQMKSEDCQ